MTSPTPPGRPVGVGIVGTGFGVKTQFPGFRHAPNNRVVALLSQTPGRAAELARELDVPHAFDVDAYDAFLAVPELDLVCVTSPPDSHLDYSRRALAAGKHVLCEKPTAMDATEALAMLEAARQTDRLALIDHELRFDPARRKFRELSHGGYLGRLHHVTIHVKSPFRLDPEKPWSWWSSSERGGGILGALGSHVVDAVRYTFGEIERARGELRTFVTERPDPRGGAPIPVTSDDYAACWLELEGGALVSCVLSAASREPAMGWRMAAHGSEGTLILETDGTLLGQKQPEREFTDLTPPQPAFDAEKLGMPDNMWARAFVIFAEEIVEALRAGKKELPLAATFEDGLRSQEVLDAVRDSAATSAWVGCAPGEQVSAR